MISFILGLLIGFSLVFMFVLIFPAPKNWISFIDHNDHLANIHVKLDKILKKIAS